MRWLVDLCYLLAAIVLSPFLLFTALTTGKYRTDWAQRFGRMPELPRAKRRVWVHAVSVGEMNAVRGLLAAWRERSPDVEFVISTTTDTGKARARELFPDLLVIRYPLDISWWVSRALGRIKPTMIVLVELELWYQFSTLAAARGIPLVVVNGRLSEKSTRRFVWIRGVAGRMFGALNWVGAQDAAYAERFERMGVPKSRIAVTGSLKWDTAQITDVIPGAEELAAACGVARISADTNALWVCGSTGPGEERVILDAYQQLLSRHPGLQLAIIPRKPERFDEVADLIRQACFHCVRRSESPDGTNRDAAERTVILGDTMGELRKFYSLADVVFVGRSLVNMGGSDMMEVAALAKPMIVGPHTKNFADAVQQLTAHRAISVLDCDATHADAGKQLARAVSELLTDPAAAAEMGGRARTVVQANTGSTDRTLKHLMEILDRAEQ